MRIALLTLFTLALAVPSPSPQEEPPLPQELSLPEEPGLPEEPPLSAEYDPTIITIPVNTYLYWVTKLFPLDRHLDVVRDLYMAAEQRVASILKIQTTRHITKGDCPDIAILFARGTNEAGNIGMVAGPSFYEHVKKEAGKNKTVEIQGLDYEANLKGFLRGGDKDGTSKMRSGIRGYLKKCPKTKLVVSGYAQGAQIVRAAIRWMMPFELRKVSSFVLFADPRYPDQLTKVPKATQLSICHEGDSICHGSNMLHLAHLTYIWDTDKAAKFVMAQMKGMLPDTHQTPQTPAQA
ncbi:cutinase-domain-containing protein [Cercophora samala]|uniref:cutinase n=1 Tax=Cercophora samala TaxID=330535 RepID=A0AA39Z7I7_9PEZI|nr:cutinase-domain-containing protein [Cercophora samala]